MICVVFVFNGVNFLQIKKTNTLKNRLKVLVLVVTSKGQSSNFLKEDIDLIISKSI